MLAGIDWEERIPYEWINSRTAMYLSPILINVLIAVGIVVAVWIYLPLLKLGGRRVPLKHWWGFRPSQRIIAKWEREEVALDAIRKLSAQERLAKLVAMDEEIGYAFGTSRDIVKEVAATGQDESIPLIKDILDDPHAPLYMIVSGAKTALEKGDAQPDYKVKLFQLLLPFTDQRGTRRAEVGSDKVPDLLLRLDRGWASRVLRAPDCLTLENKMFRYILNALNDHGVRVPKEQLVQWLSEVSHPEHKEYLDGLISIELARTMYFYDKEVARRHWEAWFDYRDDIVPLCAGDYLLQMAGLHRPDVQLTNKKNAVGFDGFNRYEKTAWLVIEFDQSTYEGQLGQLEFLERDYLQLLPSALTEVGASRTAKLVEQYWALYGDAGPAAGEKERKKQIKAMGLNVWHDKETALEEEADWAKADSEIGVRKYLLAHAEHFDWRQDFV